MRKARAKTMIIIRRSAMAFLFLWATFSLCSAKDKPKAVSVDYCADQFILSLADRNQILALTPDADAAHSFYKDRAQGVPKFKASLEEVLHIKPDIVINYWAGFNMLPLLQKAHINVASAEYGTTTQILYQNMRLFGQALGQISRADAMIRDHQNRLRKVKAHPLHKFTANRPLRTTYLAPGGITAGENTFVTAILKLTGLTPISKELGLNGWVPLPLEALIKNPPDLIIGSFFDLDKQHISSWSLSRHGRIKKMIDKIPTIIVPSRYLSCNGIFSVDAAEYIQRESQKLFMGQDSVIATDSTDVRGDR